MSFWTYLLHCRGGYFYVGHTDDLERRIGEHESGLIPGFTADHQPVDLVWSDQFANRDDAKAAERKLKGWSRAKKLAHIRGDWAQISALAKGKSGPSTSSGKSDLGGEITPKFDYPELVEGLSFSMQPHPEAQPSRDCAVGAKVRIADGLAWLIFEAAPAGAIRIPRSDAPQRLDGLWQTTCFELFVKRSEGYTEFNFSPSGDWAAYRFSGYRDGMKNLPMRTEPTIETLENDVCLIVSISMDQSVLPQGCTFALSAVIEELDGTKSYWALAHPSDKPDFHHPTCFAATLPPPSAA
jgi:predicted GIY-YIG superfamily endonuclease